MANNRRWGLFTESMSVRPLAAEWLNKHGYEFHPQVRLPGNLRTDYLARHKITGEILILEVKGNITHWYRDLPKILSYRDAIKPLNPQLALALPYSELTRRITTDCDAHDIFIIELTTPIDEPNNEALIAYVREVARRVHSTPRWNLPKDIFMKEQTNDHN